MASLAAVDDVRLCAGLYDICEAARLIDLPEQTFRRWARGYEHGAPLLHMLDRDARRESSVPFIAL
jgi:helix-turn-helix protein